MLLALSHKITSHVSHLGVSLRLAFFFALQIMDTLSNRQRLFDEQVLLRRQNEQLVAENATLRRELLAAKQQIARLKFLLRRTI